MFEKYAKIFGQLNKETQEHSIRVADICRFLAPYVDVSEDKMYEIGFVHDVGKLYIPSRIIKKSEKLTPLEREIVDLHSYYGYRILKDMGSEEDIYLPVLFHHGFMKPRFGEEKGNMTEEIMKYICIVHTADIYDAMLSKRVYHEPFHIDEVMEVLSKDALASNTLLYALEEYSCTENTQSAKIIHI